MKTRVKNKSMEAAKYLKRGDLTLIARKLGYSRNTVYKVSKSAVKNERISQLIEAYAKKRKDELDSITSEME